MPKYKIGLVLDDSYDRNDGVQQYVKTLGKWLTVQGHDVKYLAGQSVSKDSSVYSLSKNIGIRYNGNNLTIPLPANIDAIKKVLTKEKFDILHIQMPFSPFLAGRIIKYAPTSTAIVGTFHIFPIGGLQKHGNKALGLVLKRQIKRIDAICSVSKPAQEFAKSHYGIESEIVPNMIDTKNMKSDVPLHPYRIVYLGRLVSRKGCMQLLKAISALPDDLVSKLEILIAGDGPEHLKLEKYVHKNKLNCVRFLGFIDESSKKHILASAEIAVFPSMGGESFGIVLIEAMSAGSGVVLGGNNPGYKSVLYQWPDLMFDPRNTIQFKDCLQKFLTDQKLRQKYHELQSNAVKIYDVNIVGKDILGMYKKALLQRQPEMR